jgi:hypothetical protein
MVRRLSNILGTVPAELISEEALLQAEEEFDKELRWLELVSRRESRLEELREQVGVVASSPDATGNQMGSSSSIQGTGPVATIDRPLTLRNVRKRHPKTISPIKPKPKRPDVMKRKMPTAANQ